MADIRCPICDRPNDANAERCWYCQAELHPNNPTGSDSNQEDWLSSLRDSDTPQPADSTPESESSEPSQNQPQNEVPEWLARIRSREQTERSETEPQDQESSTPEPAQPNRPDFPDWLTSIVPESGPEKTGTTSPAASNEGGENVDEDADEWLKKLESWQPNQAYEAHHFRGGGHTDDTEAGENAAADSDQPTEANASVPDLTAANDQEEWRKQFESWTPNEASTLPQTPAAEPASPEQAQEPAADWLQAFQQELDNEPETANESPVSEEKSENSAAFLPDEETLELTGAAAGSKEEPAAAANEPDEGNWLSAFKGLQPDENLADQVLPPSSNNEQPQAPFDNSDMKTFLGNSEPNANTPAEKAGPTIEPAALPAWIKALSPKQKSGAAAHSHEALRPPDARGPLAGIEGTLPGEELNQYYTRPQTFSGAVKVSEGQQQRTLTLKNIVDQAHWVDEGIPSKASSISWIFRALVSAALLLAVFIPLFIKGIPSVLPTLYPGEVVKTLNTVNALPIDKPVLVAADFDGSLYGELNWAMQPLFSQLMARNIPIAYLSTNSVGTSLFHQALQPLLARYPAYASSDHLVNLGYLPGGSTGMQSLAADPATALPLDVNSHPVWASAPLKEMNHLSDFGAVIVISENADTARYWIEQVQPSLGTTPMLVVISAQSAPLLQPYYDSGQISGYLSGLYSAAAYETLEKSPQNASGHLASFQLTMILTALLIFVGGIVSLVLFRPKTQKQQGKQR